MGIYRGSFEDGPLLFFSRQLVFLPPRKILFFFAPLDIFQNFSLHIKKKAIPLSPPLPIRLKIKLHTIHYPFIELVTSILFANDNIFETFHLHHQFLKYFPHDFFAKNNFSLKRGEGGGGVKKKSMG